MINTCYVTSKPSINHRCYFGSPVHVTLDLTQEVFAHFIIRAGKDTMHKQIMKDIEIADDDLLIKAEMLIKAEKISSPNTDAYIDAAIEHSIAADKLEALLTQKAESGVRILRQMKKEYEQTGKLTS